jgi:MarR family transcriptional regulator, organic hydroperoxide resistance regulator
MATTKKSSRDGFTDYTRNQGGAAIGARLRRLSERIDREATQLYGDLGVDFEQRWFGVLNLLAQFGPLSVGELAAPLGISHASVSQTRESLERRGYIRWTPNPGDARSRHLRLTPAGKRLVARLTPLWRALADSGQELDDEAGNVVAALERLDRALERQSLIDRVLARLPPKFASGSRRR